MYCILLHHCRMSPLIILLLYACTMMELTSSSLYYLLTSSQRLMYDSCCEYLQFLYNKHLRNEQRSSFISIHVTCHLFYLKAFVRPIWPEHTLPKKWNNPRDHTKQNFKGRDESSSQLKGNTKEEFMLVQSMYYYVISIHPKYIKEGWLLVGIPVKIKQDNLVLNFFGQCVCIISIIKLYCALLIASGWRSTSTLYNWNSNII